MLKCSQPTLTNREAFMAHAVHVARQGLGPTAPNPNVGAVLVADGRIVAEGFHERFGQPHAEVQCLANARQHGVDASQCELFVTLEPCNHYGKTPPCTRAILEAGIRRVAIGCLDPNPDVAGGGAAFLESNGIQVEVGLLHDECRDLIDDFLVWKNTQRPYVFLKMATTLDGRIACRNGHSSYVTGAPARKYVHELRARVGAVMIGGGTLRADNPGLDVRLQPMPEHANDPLAVIVTRNLPGKGDVLKLIESRPQQTVFLTSNASAQHKNAQRLIDLGVKVIPLPAVVEADGKENQDFGLNLEYGLIHLRQKFGIHHVLCEGGGGLAMSLFDSGLVDETLLFQAPKILGDDQAIPVFYGRAPMHMNEALPVRITSIQPIGDDILLTLKRPR